MTLREEYKSALLTRRVLQARIVPRTRRCDRCDLTEIVLGKGGGIPVPAMHCVSTGQETEPSAWPLASRVSGVPGIER